MADVDRVLELLASIERGDDTEAWDGLGYWLDLECDLVSAAPRSACASEVSSTSTPSAGRRTPAPAHEDRTDQLALPAYAALGDAGCERLAELARPFGRAVVDAGLLSPG
jgi:hypothetical protein